MKTNGREPRKASRTGDKPNNIFRRDITNRAVQGPALDSRPLDARRIPGLSTLDVPAAIPKTNLPEPFRTIPNHSEPIFFPGDPGQAYALEIAEENLTNAFVHYLQKRL